MPPNMPPQGMPVQKKSSPWIWILGGIAVFFCLIIVTCGVVGFMAMRAVRNVGFDPDLMKSNPGLAMAKMVTAMNPNLEKLSSDENKGTITVRDKTNGKIMTFRFDTAKKQMVITDSDGKQVSMSTSGEGKDTSLTIQSSDGTMKFGAAAGGAPAWVPVYPGSNPQGTLAAQTADGAQNAFTFKTSDAASKVITYYQDQLKSNGFTVTLTSTSEQGGMLTAEDTDKKRTIMIAVGSSGSETEGTVTATEKK
jgi:hypothetical protein